jgi:signal transduction histidine kinase
MRTPRLRVQLAAVTFVTTLPLVVVTSAIVTSRSDDLRRMEARDGVQRRAAGLADDVAQGLLHGARPSDALPRHARGEELVDAQGSHIAGQRLVDDRATARRVRSDLDDLGLSSPPKTDRPASRAVGVAAVIVRDELRGAVVVARPLPRRRGWRQLYGLDVPAAVVLAFASAALGWWSAGRISRPLRRLTVHARALALGADHQPDTTSSIPEIATLGAAMAHLAAGVRRDGAQRDHADAEHRRLAHELRTPLTTIRLRVEAGNIDGDAARLLLGQLDRIDRVANELSALRGTSTDQEIDLARIAEEVTGGLRAIARWERVTLSIVVGGPAVIRGEHAAITDALNNVVENALRFTPAGGRVRVGVGRRGADVVVQVDDTGPGFEEGARATVLAPGVRVIGSRFVPGTGQGLAIVAATVDRHRGALELGRSELGGALVRIILPAVPAVPSDAAATYDRAEAHAAAVLESSSGRGEQVTNGRGG